MIVVNNEDYVVGWGISIDRVDVNGEKDLIRVYVNSYDEMYYIGVIDRDDYQIYDVNVPDNSKQYKYIDGQFTEIVIEQRVDPTLGNLNP